MGTLEFEKVVVSVMTPNQEVDLAAEYLFSRHDFGVLQPKQQGILLDELLELSLRSVGLRQEIPKLPRGDSDIFYPTV